MKTVNLNLSQKLKAAGYKQDSYFFWNDGLKDWYLADSQHSINKVDCFASPTADELLEQLPYVLEIGDIIYVPNYLKDRTVEKGRFKFVYVAFFWHEEKENNLPSFREDSLADACAKMWLYLKEQSLLEGETA